MQDSKAFWKGFQVVSDIHSDSPFYSEKTLYTKLW